LLAVSPVVTQAYILKHNLPFNEEPTVNDEQRLAQCVYELETITQVANILAMRLADSWQKTDKFLKEQEGD
jgi:hypothetical protein